jgi:hypothetical protein
LVALYIATDSFKAEETARSKKIAPRISWRAVMHHSSCNGGLPDEILQKETPITWTTVPRDKVGRR